MNQPDDSDLSRTFTRRRALATIGGAAAAAMLAPRWSIGQTTRRSTPPNLLWIITDQQHVETISATGCPHVNTPAMDRLVQSGTRFNAAYCPSSVCAPSRGAMLTGRPPLESGVINNGGQVIVNGVPNIGEWFSANSNYETLYAGKWHLPLTYQPKIAGFNVLQPGFVGHGNISDPAVATACNAYLRNRQADKPFLMIASMMQPHDICEWLRLNLDNVEPPRYPELARELPALPANFLPNAREPADIIKMRQTDEPGLGKWSDDHWRYYLWSYFRHVEQVDAEIGTLLRTLDETGYADNTAIIFVADHGEGLARHQMVRKNCAYDDASRVPMVICWPGQLPRNRQIDSPVSGLDIVPTLCDLAGIAAPPLMRGQSLLSAIGGAADVDRAVVCDVPGNIGKVVRTAKYKYITYANDPVDMLFDMHADPLEMHNLVSEAAHAAALEQLRGKLRDWERSLKPCRPNTPNINVWRS